jgi:hypothetical protein
MIGEVTWAVKAATEQRNMYLARRNVSVACRCSGSPRNSEPHNRYNHGTATAANPGSGPTAPQRIERLSEPELRVPDGVISVPVDGRWDKRKPAHLLPLSGSHGWTPKPDLQWAVRLWLLARLILVYLVSCHQSLRLIHGGMQGCASANPNDEVDQPCSALSRPSPKSRRLFSRLVR